MKPWNGNCHPDIPSTDRKSLCSLGGFESPTIGIHLEGCFPIDPSGRIPKEWRYQRLMERANFPFSLERVSGSCNHSCLVMGKTPGDMTIPNELCDSFLRCGIMMGRHFERSEDKWRKTERVKNDLKTGSLRA